MTTVRLGKHSINALLFARRNPGYNYATNDTVTKQAIKRLVKLKFLELDSTSKSIRFRITEKGKRYAYENL